MGAYANRRNNELPFVDGGISASMKFVQPLKGFSHEAVYRIRLYNLYCLFGGVIEGCDEFSVVRIRTHTQTSRHFL